MKHLPALAAFLFLPLPAFASDRVFLAAPDGVVYEADLRAQSLEEFAHVSPYVTAMAADARHLYVADDWVVHVVDLRTGGLERSLVTNTPGHPLGDVISMATFGNELYVGTIDARVARVDGVTGEVSGLRILPTSSQLDQVTALAVDEEHIFVASYLGFVFRAPRQGGEFESLGRGLGFIAMQAITRYGEDLFVGESTGYVGRLDPNTGEVLHSFRTDAVRHMAIQGDTLFICSAYSNRIWSVSLRDRPRARALHEPPFDLLFEIPFDVDGMVVARDRGDRTVSWPRPRALGSIPGIATSQR